MSDGHVYDPVGRSGSIAMSLLEMLTTLLAVVLAIVLFALHFVHLDTLWASFVALARETASFCWDLIL